MMVIEIVVISTTAASCADVATTHSSLRRNSLVVHIGVAVARVPSHMGRWMGSKRVWILRHRGCSHVGALDIKVSYETLR